MDALYDLSSNKSYDEKTKIRLSYDILKGASKYKWFKPTFKMYLNKHVRSRFLQIDSADWDTALFLPLARFEGASNSTVWKDSRAEIRGR
jgi:hypothetical protein